MSSWETSRGTRVLVPGCVKTFRAAERPGVYCRVLEPGSVTVGDPVALQPHLGPALSVLELFRWSYRQHLTADELRRLLAAPIPEKDRPHYQALLAVAQ